MTPYLLELRPAALRELADLDPPARKAVADLIVSLAASPRPSGVKALTGHRPYLRVRQGDYRVIYAVDDVARRITIAAVGHRREIYRALDL